MASNGLKGSFLVWLSGSSIYTMFVCMKVLKEPSIFDECKKGRTSVVAYCLSLSRWEDWANWDFDLLDWAFWIGADKVKTGNSGEKTGNSGQIEYFMSADLEGKNNKLVGNKRERMVS